MLLSGYELQISPGKPYLRNPMFRCMIQAAAIFRRKEGYIMAKNKEPKTNAMRILDRMKISYKTFTYECDEFTDAQHTADLIAGSSITSAPHLRSFCAVVPESSLGLVSSTRTPPSESRSTQEKVSASAHTSPTTMIAGVTAP